MRLACAGLVCTGGLDFIINGWDLRQGKMGSLLSPAFAVEGYYTNGFHDSAYAMTSVGSPKGSGPPQLLTGASKQDLSKLYNV